MTLFCTFKTQKQCHMSKLILCIIEYTYIILRNLNKSIKMFSLLTAFFKYILISG